jgi:hypothetical protein
MVAQGGPRSQRVTEQGRVMARDLGGLLPRDAPVEWRHGEDVFVSDAEDGDDLTAPTADDRLRCAASRGRC